MKLATLSPMLKTYALMGIVMTTLFGCDEALKINQVEIIAPKHNGLEGNIKIGSFSFDIESKEHQIAMTSFSNLELNLKLNFKNNLPQNKISPTALLNQPIALSFSKEKGGHAEFKEATLESPTQAFDDFTCDKEISVRSEGTKLIIDLGQFKSLTSACQGKGIDRYSPDMVGYRNINEYSLLRHNFFSLDHDAKLGEEFVVDYLKNNRHLILDQNHNATLYIKDVMNNIVANSDRPDLKPKVYIINAKIMNAFALPGGYVFVFRGLMEKSPSESALTSVLSHEWAHVTARHGTENMTRAIDRILLVLAAKLVIDVSLEQQKIQAKEIISNVAFGAMMAGSELFLMNKSRAAELEADTLGTQYAYLAGFNSWGISEMFQVFKEESGTEFSTIEKLMSSHPDHDTRINNGYMLSAQFYPDRSIQTPNRDRLSQALAEMSNISYPTKEESKNIGMGFAQSINDFTKSKLEDYAYQIYFSKQ